MQLFDPTAPVPLGIVFDTAMQSIDDVLALALLFGFDGKRDARMVSLSVSRPSLKAAAFCDAVSRFYAGPAAAFMRLLPVGMQTEGPKPAGPEPMLETPLLKPEYKHTIQQMNDTADPAAVIRNAFTSQKDGNSVAVLSGPCTNYAQTLSLPGVPELIGRKAKFLVVVMPEQPDPAMEKFLSAWPTPVVIATRDIGDQILYPASSIEKDYAWSPAHPIVDAYKAYKPMPYDAPTATMAGLLYAVRSKEGYFKLSDPGTASFVGGKLKITPSAQGKHRQLTFDPDQKDRILKVYTEVCSTKPVPRMPRFRPMVDEEKKDEEKPKAPTP